MAASTINPDLPKRLRTAVILILLVLSFGIFGAVSATGAKIFSLLGLVAILLAGYEYFSIRKQQLNFSTVSSLWFIVAAILLPSALSFTFVTCLNIDKLLPYYSGTVLFSIIFIIWAASVGFKSSLELPFFVRLLAADVLTAFLLGAGGSALVILAALNPVKVLFLIFLVAIADSSAYFVGRGLSATKYGNAKIAQLVSPKKTVIGTVSALFITAAFATACSSFLEAGLASSFLLGLLIAFCSQAGDFAKSIVKRSFGTKDFSNLLPGHGGVFDRIDGLLGAAPLFLIFVICNQ